MPYGDISYGGGAGVDTTGLPLVTPEAGTGTRTRGSSATETIEVILAGRSDRARGQFVSETIVVSTLDPTGVGYEVNGRTRGWSAIATVSTAPAPKPDHEGYLPTEHLTYPTPVIIHGIPYANSAERPWLPTADTHGLWGKFDIVIDGVNVTYFRVDSLGRPVPTIVSRWTDKDPGGDDQCDLIFPKLTSLDAPGTTSDCKWLRTDATVSVRKLLPDGTTLKSKFEGVVSPIEDVTDAPPGTHLVIHCIGLWGRLDEFITLPRPSIDQYVSPIPRGYRTPIDSSQFIYAHLHRARLYGWPGSMARPANSGIPTGEQGNFGEPIASRTVQTVLSQMQRAGSYATVTQDSVHRRTFVIKNRRWDTSHHDFTIQCAGRGITHNLVKDPTTAPNAFYGHGQAPWGPVDPTTGQPAALADWMNWQYPDAPATIPPYPLPTSPLETFVAGDGHGHFQAFSDELRTRGYDLDSQDTYLSSDVDEIDRFQGNSGIQVDGIVGPQTWNQAFQVGVNAKVLASAYIKELVTKGPESPFLTNARGGVVAPNPSFDPRDHPRREILEQYGPITKKDAVKSALQEYALISTPIYRGTITARNIDPPEMCALDTASGMTMIYKDHAGADRRFYVSQVERTPGMLAGSDRTVTWTVSEIPEGLMTLAQRLARDIGIKDLVASNRPPRHGAKQIPNFPVFDGESGAGLLPSRAQTGGLWNDYLIPMGAQADIGAVKLIATAGTQIAACMFTDPYMTVERLVALPGLADPSAGTDDPWAVNASKLEDFGICWATGGPNAMQGYWPNTPPDGALTGVLFDGASWPFRANSAWGKLFVWTRDSCSVSGDPTARHRVFFPNPVQ